MSELGYTSRMEASTQTSLAVLSVSIVIYKPELALLERTVSSLGRAVVGLEGSCCVLIMVDNSPCPMSPQGRAALEALLPGELVKVSWLAGHGNPGYGRGHNLALRTANSACHLILNPDVELAPDALVNALRFLDANPECVLVSPVACWPDGRVQHLCKRFPSPFVLALRGFGADCLKRWFDAPLARYEYRDAPQALTLWDPQLVSGCCMLFRTDVLLRLGGFDSSYFLYFEDFDLSLRAARFGRLARVGEVRVTHHGGNAARKGGRHLWLFLRSAFRFYAGHGVAWWRRGA